MGVQALQLSHCINSIATKSPIHGTGSINLLLYIFQFGVDGKKTKIPEFICTAYELNAECIGSRWEQYTKIEDVGDVLFSNLKKGRK